MTVKNARAHFFREWGIGTSISKSRIDTIPNKNGTPISQLELMTLLLFPDGRMALQAAVEGGHLAVVERLLQQKADVNAAAAKSDGRTALQAAAEGGHLVVVERLRVAGAR